jgi:ubiquitin-protein ligase E3 C
MPNFGISLGGLEEISTFIDVGLLSTALVREFSSRLGDQIPPRGRLWLLAHFIALHRLQNRSSQEPEFLRALSLQLSSSSAEIVGRVELTDSEMAIDSVDRDDSLQKSPPPLPAFIKNELLSLVNQASISGLLAKFNIDYAKASAAGEEDASLLASYALTLLRIFPGRGDEIRMWLYLGSMTTSSGIQVPALKFFWQAMSLTNTFSAIRSSSKTALAILRPETQRQSTLSLSDSIRDQEWRTILLFLELYTFVLRFTDDEEFLSARTANFEQANGRVSRIRESALPIEDVQQLTVFLKNLAFTSYFNAGELSDGEHQVEGGLGTYFGTNTSTSRFQTPDHGDPKEKAVRRPFAGITGMSFDYVRTVVTVVMRMLYERDSRRRFLPKDHWLMTSRFDMEGFITAVVMEEERQHRIREEGEDEDAEESPDLEMREDLTTVGMSLPRRAQRIEALRRQQQKTARKKVLASVGPRLEVLQNMPFAIPFETRVQIFRQFVLLDQSRRRGGNVDPDIWRMSMVQNAIMNGVHPNNRPGREILGRHHAKIRRDQVFEDAYAQFYELGEGLKEPIQITFVDKFDTVEAGIDGGGVTKEFLTSVTNEAFRSEKGPNLFVTNDQNLLYPNPAALDERRELLKQAGFKPSDQEWIENVNNLFKQYEFLGRIVGKCLYEGILVDIGFAGFFLLKWAASGASASEGGYRANINDLRDLDEGLYQGLLKLKNYPGNVEDFSLDFTITDTVSLPGSRTQTITRDLMPNGSNISVTNENRPLYVSYVAKHRLQLQPYYQTQAFLRGLGEIINPSWLSMFNQSELQTLIGGDASEIDVEDLRLNTAYGGVYQIGDDGLEHHTIRLFWKVMKDLDDSERRKVLKYVTSTPRAPLLGFSQLNPRFSIRDAGDDEARLPSTSTCVNLLKLPRYSTATALKQKLLYAVNSGAGFDLS